MRALLLIALFAAVLTILPLENAGAVVAIPFLLFALIAYFERSTK